MLAGCLAPGAWQRHSAGELDAAAATDGAQTPHAPAIERQPASVAAGRFGAVPSHAAGRGGRINPVYPCTPRACATGSRRYQDGIGFRRLPATAAPVSGSAGDAAAGGGGRLCNVAILSRNGQYCLMAFLGVRHRRMVYRLAGGRGTPESARQYCPFRDSMNRDGWPDPCDDRRQHAGPLELVAGRLGSVNIVVLVPQGCTRAALERPQGDRPETSTLIRSFTWPPLKRVAKGGIFGRPCPLWGCRRGALLSASVARG